MSKEKVTVKCPTCGKTAVVDKKENPQYGVYGFCKDCLVQLDDCDMRMECETMSNEDKAYFKAQDEGKDVWECVDEAIKVFDKGARNNETQCI